MSQARLTRLVLENFTAFKRLDIELGPGVNIFIGANGTGKTHVLKLLYSACDITRTQGSFAEKLIRVFLPHQSRLGRLAHRQKGGITANIRIYRGQDSLKLTFSNQAKDIYTVKEGRRRIWLSNQMECAYIPVKEMLANAPGFRSLYAGRTIHFEEIYPDIIDRALLPILRGPMTRDRKKLLRIIKEAIEGTVSVKEEAFFLKNAQGELEFNLLAEGLRKLALLWLLIQNGTLLAGSFLFWDEPEANINPRLMGTVVEILLALQRNGVQVFLASHDYVILKEFNLRAKEDDQVRYHSLYRDDDRKTILFNSTDDYYQIHPNAIADTFSDIYDRDIVRALGRRKK